MLNVKVGDTVVIEKGVSVYDTTVTSVGRKYFTVELVLNRVNQYSLETGLANVDSNYRARAWESREAYYSEKKHSNCLMKVEELIRKIRPTQLSTEQLEKLLDVYSALDNELKIS